MRFCSAGLMGMLGLSMLAACGGGADAPDSATSSPSEPPSTSTVAPTTRAAPVEPGVVVEQATVLAPPNGGDGVLAALVRNGADEAMTVTGRLTVRNGGAVVTTVDAQPTTLLPGQLGAFVESAAALPAGATLEVVLDATEATQDAIDGNRELRTSGALYVPLGGGPAPCHMFGTVTNDGDAEVHVRVSIVAEDHDRIVNAGHAVITLAPGRDDGPRIDPPPALCPPSVSTVHVFTDPVAGG